jgi:hypothetical protein
MVGSLRARARLKREWWPSRRAAACLPAAVSLWLALPLPAQAFVTYRKLDRLVSILAARPVRARCFTQREWDADRANSRALAYTLLRDPLHPNRVVDYTSLSPQICAGALAISGVGKASLAREALAALVLTHEAFHLRIWRLRGNEAAVECRAIGYVRQTVQFLSRSAQLADVLLLYALVDHYAEELTVPAYADASCNLPQPPDANALTEARFTIGSAPTASRIAGFKWEPTGIGAACGFAVASVLAVALSRRVRRST